MNFYSFLILIFLINPLLFSMNLGKRPNPCDQQPKPKKTCSTQSFGIKKLQPLARSNIEFSEDLIILFNERPNLSDEAGNTLLHYAVLYHNHRLLMTLLQNDRLDINAPNLSGETPLICAVKANNEAAVKVLMERKPELTSVYEAFTLTQIINPKISYKLLKYLFSLIDEINWAKSVKTSQLGMTNEAQRNKTFCLLKIQQYKNLNERIQEMPDFLEKLEIPDDHFGQKKLNPRWFEYFEDDFVSSLRGFIEDSGNYSIFINFFEDDDKEDYFFVFLELFFGVDDAQKALFAHGPRRVRPDLRNVTIADMININIPDPNQEEDIINIVSDELIELMKKAPTLAVKLTKHYYQDRKIASLKKIFSAMPWWFINIQENNRTALLRSSLARANIYKDSRFAELFLQYDGFNINRIFNNEETILEYVLASENFDIFTLLLRREPNINRKNHRGNTILMNALRKKEFFKEILHHKPDVTIKDPIGCTVLKQAIIYNDFNTVKALLNYIKNNCYTCFHNEKESYIASAKENLSYQESKNSEPKYIMVASMVLNEIEQAFKEAY